MRWSERQQAMLREIGVRLWLPPAAGPQTESLAETAAEAVAETVAISAPRAAAKPDPAPASTREAAPRPVAMPAGAATAPSMADPAIARLDWPALREAVAGCQACALARTRKNTVFGVGHERAHWMIVGEAPGEQEDREGEPFVGAAGQLLDRMLAALGLTRGEAPAERQVFIANTLKCRPPRNRNPEPEELQRCQPYLERQVALVQPRVILAMGRFAVQSLLGTDEAIGRLRGRVHQWRGVPLVVTYHPAYLLRQPADKAKAWEDLCLAAELGHPAAGDGAHASGG